MRVQGPRRGEIWSAPLFSDAHAARPADGGPGPRAYYRPLVLVSLAWTLDLVGISPPVLRLQNLVLHVLLAFWLWRRLRSGLDPALALGGAGLFLLHPLAPEVVAWISGRSDAMALAGFALALEALELGIAHQARVPLGLAVLAFAGACFSKETALLLAPLLPGLGGLRAGRSGARAGLGVALAGAGAYLVARRLALGAWAPVAAEGISRAGMGERLRELGTWCLHLVWPADLRHFFYPPEPVPGPAGLAALALVVALGALAARRDPAGATLGLGLVFLPLAPLLLFTQPAFPFGDRYLYLGCAGLGLLVPLAVAGAVPGRGGALGVGLLAVGAGALAGPRATAWSSEIGLWERVVEQAYRPPRAWIWLAEALRARGRADRALEVARAGLREAPGDPALRFTEGLALKALGRLEEAEAAFAAVGPESDPVYPSAQVNRVYLARRRGDRALAGALVDRLLERFPEFSTGWAQRGSLRLEAGEAAAAVEDLTKALARFERDPAVHLDRALALRALGRRDEALADLARAVELAPGQARYMGALGTLLAEVGRTAEARRWLAEAEAAAGGGGGR